MPRATSRTSASASRPPRGSAGLSRTSEIDERLLRLARTHCHAARAEHAVAGFSRLGEHGAVWFAIGAIGAIVEGRERARWLRASQAVAGTYAANVAIKLLVRRRRPSLPGLPALTGTPSRE